MRCKLIIPKYVYEYLAKEAENRLMTFSVSKDKDDCEDYVLVNEYHDVVIRSNEWLDIAEYMGLKHIFFNTDNVKAMVDQAGEDTALDIVIEECSELIKTITKYKRNCKLEAPDSANYYKLIASMYEELADVIISAKMLEIVLNKEYEFAGKKTTFNIDDYLEIKMHRNMQRVEAGEFH